MKSTELQKSKQDKKNNDLKSRQRREKTERKEVNGVNTEIAPPPLREGRGLGKGLS
jgi:hypothetical protein